MAGLKGAMESERPRASGTYVYARTLSHISSSGVVPIRAPLTLDDVDENDEDDDFGSESDVRNSANSDVSSNSRGIDFGTDDEFESGSSDPDDETADEDAGFGGIRVHMPFREDPDDETGESSGLSGRSRVYRPFAGEQNEEMSENYSSFGEEESEKSNEVDIVSQKETDSEVKGVSLNARIVIPRARLSLDDDEIDEILSNEDEDGLRVVKVLCYSEDEVEDRSLNFEETLVMDEPNGSGSIAEMTVMGEPNGSGSIAEMTVMDEPNGSGSTSEMTVMDEPNGSDSIAAEFISVEDETTVMDEPNGSGSTGEMTVMDEPDGSGSITGDFLSVEEEMTVMDEPDGSGSTAEMRVMDEPDGSGSTGEMTVMDEPDDSGSIAADFLSVEEEMTVMDEPNGSGSTAEMAVMDEPNGSGSIAEMTVMDEPDGSGSTGEMTVMDEPNGSGSTAGEFISLEEEMMRMNNLDNCSISSGTIEEKNGKFAREESDELAVESVDETFNQSIEQVSIQASIIGKTDHCEVDTLMITVDGSVGLESGETGIEDAEFEFDKQKSESFGTNGTQRCLNMANHDVSASDLGNITDLKVDSRSENEEKQDPKVDECVKGSNFGNSMEKGDDPMDNDEQSSLQNDNQVDNEVTVEESFLLFDKDAEIITSGNCSVITDEETENETQIEQLIHDQILEEFNGRRAKPFHSTLNVSEDIYVDDFTCKRTENIRNLETKLLRIVKRLGLSADDSIVTEVLCKLALASEEHRTSHGFYPDFEGRDELDFTINILVLGKTGVGKSATINSIFGETKSQVGAFGHTTKSANYIIGETKGIKIRVLDTPGLRSSATEERLNREVLISVKKLIRTFPIDIVLYIDRLDEHSVNTNDIQLLRTITSSLGSSIWKNAIFVLTHAASTVLESSSFEEFVTRRSFRLCQSIKQAVPEMGSFDGMMPRVVLAENNKLLPDIQTDEFRSQIWISQLLLLCCSAKIMTETNYSQKNQTLMEKSDLFGSPLKSFEFFCSLWNMFLHGTDSRKDSCLHNEFEGKIEHFLDSQVENVWNEQNKANLKLQTFIVNKQSYDEEKRVENGEIIKGFEDRTVLDCIRRQRRRLGIRLFDFIDVSDLKIGFSTCNDRVVKAFFSVESNEEQEEKMILMKMRGSMALMNVIPLLISAFICVYGGN